MAGRAPDPAVLIAGAGPTGLTLALWLPILLSAVFVFIVSSIIHMTPLWHKNDYPAMPNQDQVTAALRMT